MDASNFLLKVREKGYRATVQVEESEKIPFLKKSYNIVLFPSQNSQPSFHSMNESIIIYIPLDEILYHHVTYQRHIWALALFSILLGVIVTNFE